MRTGSRRPSPAPLDVVRVTTFPVIRSAKVLPGVPGVADLDEEAAD